MKLLLLNATANTGSTGRISEEIGRVAKLSGYEVWMGYGREAIRSSLNLIPIGSKADFIIHALDTRLFDRHGFMSRRATLKFIRVIERIQPDIINVHNLHGYYVNIEILFNYLKTKSIPIVWTLHDCWPFTGHCANFDRYNCVKWKTQCYQCPSTKAYPSSWLIDNSESNFLKKKRIFTQIKNITFITPSIWLKNILIQSFLKDYPVHVINNGVDLGVFNPEYVNTKKKSNLGNTKRILGVASVWSRGKGLSDFIALSQLLGNGYQIILVGLNDKQISLLPKNVLGIKRTENVFQLAELYSMADVFVNPTYLDNFPTVNLEALACGTPVITYNTGGSPEAIDEQTGFVVEKGNIAELHQAILNVFRQDKEFYKNFCRKRAEVFYNKNDRFKDYIDLFNSLLITKKSN